MAEKTRVYRGIEYVKPDVKYPQSGKYFTTRPSDAIDFASRQGTYGGKVSYLDLTKDELKKAEELSKAQKTRLSGEVIVDEELLEKQKTDIIKTLKARGKNLSKLALKGLSRLAALPAAAVLNLFSTSSLNEGEVDRTLELLGEEPNKPLYGNEKDIF
jgi:hypothetical protein